MKTLAFLLIAGCAWAQIAWAQIDVPSLGVMLDAQGSARPVFGVAASVTLGNAVAAGVVSAACSAFCLFKTDASIVSAAATIPAPAGPALFAFDGAAAWVYFPKTRALARWHDDQLDPAAFQVSGEILAIAVQNGQLVFAVRNSPDTSLVADGDTALLSLPHATGPVMLLDGAVLFTTREAIVLRRADATELRFPLTLPEGFSALGAGYVQIRTRGAMYALRTDAGHEQLFQLPEPAQ